MAEPESQSFDQEAWEGVQGLPIRRGCAWSINLLILLSCCTMCTVPGVLEKRRDAHHSMAAAFLREVASAQQRFHDDDADEDGRSD